MIRLMQPAWRGPDREVRLAQFWAEIDASPEFVVTVAVQVGEGWSLGGIFSTRDAALAWAANRGAACVVQARRLNNPAWGCEGVAVQ